MAGDQMEMVADRVPRPAGRPCSQPEYDGVGFCAGKPAILDADIHGLPAMGTSPLSLSLFAEDSRNHRVVPTHDVDPFTLGMETEYPRSASVSPMTT